jgi:tRNA dimethylallyltransferase
MDKILIICGPTATGKTDLAIKLAKIFNGELVSADSRQIYTGMDIGTGKDVGKKIKSKNISIATIFKSQKFNLIPYTINNIPLWMLDVVKPEEDFSVAHYQYLSRQVINNIINRGKLPIIVGGSGLYINSILHDSQTFSIPPDLKLRQDLNIRKVIELQELLAAADKRTWDLLNNSDQNNPRRLIRKIEIAKFLQKSKLKKELSQKFDFLQIGLTTNNKLLYERIDQRVEKRVEQGIEPEIQILLEKGYDWNLLAMNSMGYIEWKPWFINSKDRTDDLKKCIIQQWKFDEHGYARRQITWFKKTPDINWFDIQDFNYLDDITNQVSAWYN